MKIRKASIEDIEDLTSLMEQLGYPTSVDKMEERFNHILAEPSYTTFVGDLDGKAVGMVGLNKSMFYERDGTYVRIVAFVVDAKHRRKGIGRKLLEQAEEWAKEQGAISIELNSGNRDERREAHQFYRKMGYENKSIGYSKSLEN
ncbi:GNAT family N-acetyltransferase [Pseudalkalibacillus sp. SCS-8]|uniref:GNAT family N-acetyltransferase n=1 Tax=Pseudalkalibacillus nanhaiensis TaxID=3115291 RepID=UPI0032DAECFD